MNFSKAVLTAGLLLGCAASAGAALDSISGKQAGDPAQLTTVVNSVSPPVTDQVAVSLAHGYPIWYQDSPLGLKLELCLDQDVPNPNPGGGTVLPCLTEEPFPALPITFPFNFGPEAFYWSAEASGTFQTTAGIGDALLVLALEASFIDGVIAEDHQNVFSRIRIRINTPAPGTYLVTHPFGQMQYRVSSADFAAERAINQTQDLGAIAPVPEILPAPLTFTTALGDAAPLDPALIPLTGPALDVAAVDAQGRSIGPFLEAADPAENIIVDGVRYLADPGTDFQPNPVPVTGGINGNVFSIQLIADAAGIGPDPDGSFNGFFLNNNDPLNPSQTVTFTDFRLMGKVFNDGPNLPPAAEPGITAFTLKDRPVNIRVFPNGTAALDPVSGTNVHGVNPMALGIVKTDPDTLAEEIVRTSVVATQRGTVQRTTSLNTGETFFRYTPAAGDTGPDSFSYVIQDTGGLISAAKTLNIEVEDIQTPVAEYRPKYSKWSISGTSTDNTANSMSILAPPRAFMSAGSVVPAATSAAQGSLHLRLNESTIDYVVNLDPMPTSQVRGIHLRVGSETDNGPILFFVHDTNTQGVFTGTKSATFNNLSLVPQSSLGISNLADAIGAIRNGNVYVSVSTVDFPDGEIRGQIRSPQIGTAAVQADGSWAFKGKSAASPGAFPGVSVRSANGNQTLTVPLRIR